MMTKRSDQNCHYAHVKGSPTPGLKSIMCLMEWLYLREEEYMSIAGAMDLPVIQLATHTLWYTGLRIAELCCPSIADVDLSNNVIHVRSTKGSVIYGRDIPIHPTLHRLLELYRDEHRLEADSTGGFFVFGGTPLSPSRYNRFLQRAVKRLDLGKCVTPSTFRSSFSRNLIHKGARLDVIRLLLGLKPSEVFHVLTPIDVARKINAIKLL